MVCYAHKNKVSTLVIQKSILCEAQIIPGARDEAVLGSRGDAIKYQGGIRVRRAVDAGRPLLQLDGPRDGGGEDLLGDVEQLRDDAGGNQWQACHGVSKDIPQGERDVGHQQRVVYEWDSNESREQAEAYKEERDDDPTPPEGSALAAAVLHRDEIALNQA